MKKGEIREEKKTINLKAAESEVMRMEAQVLQDLKGRIRKAIEENAALAPYGKQILLDITSEGLRIQIADDRNRPMFASGSAQLEPYSRLILREIGRTLNGVPNRIGISGHTDTHLYSGGTKGYSNWELSSDRANAARREISIDGLDEGRVLRVVGLSSAVPLDPQDPENPVNRRISIVVMNKKTEMAISKDSGAIEAENKPDTQDGKSDAVKKP